MKICYIANAANVHTAKWANHFAKKGCDVTIITFDPANEVDSRVKVHELGTPYLTGPLRYFLCARNAASILRNIKPDIIHAHYASGYGTLARLAGGTPLILSVWGSDVFEFPLRSALHARLLKSNLNAADLVFSTGRQMAEEVRKYLARHVYVTPFGVDCEQFRPGDRLTSDEFVVGVVKSLEKTSGMEYVLYALKALIERCPDTKIRLDIVGSGPEERAYKRLARRLHLEHQVNFVGRMPHSEIPSILRRFSVYLSLPVSESFGVALLEASATGIPVVASQVGGVWEVVKDRTTGYLVPPRNSAAAAEALERLIRDPKQATSLGEAGRKWVLENFEWTKTAGVVEEIYRNVLANSVGSSREGKRELEN